MTLGQQLKRVRKLRGLTLQNVCDKTGIAKADLSKYENDIKHMNIVTLARLLNALGAKMDIKMLGCGECKEFFYCRKEDGRRTQYGCSEWEPK